MSLGGIPVFLTYLVRFAHGNFSKNVSFLITYHLTLRNILDTVEKHLVRDHGQEPQFTCEICGSKIIHHKDFQQHMKSHRNPERKCPLCPLKFITKGYKFITSMVTAKFGFPNPVQKSYSRFEMSRKRAYYNLLGQNVIRGVPYYKTESL